MTATCVLQPRVEHTFEPKETLSEYDQMQMTVKALTPKQIKSLMSAVHTFNQTYGLMKAVTKKESQTSTDFPLLKPQQANSLMDVIRTFNRTYGSKVTKDKPPLPFVQKKIEQINATKEPSPLFTPQVTVPKLQEPEVLSFDQLGILFYANAMRADTLDDATTKLQIDANHQEATKLHQEKIEKIKEKIKSEGESSNWSVAISVFSWIGSLLGIITGVALIATGIGAVAGAMILVGGVCTLTNQILEITGGWDKICKLLPDDTPERKNAIKTWIQLAIAILGIVLGLAGGVLGGFTPISEAMQFANAFMGGFVLMAMGITQIGKGIVDKKVKDNQASVKRSEIKIAKNDHKREDLVELIEDKYSRRERLSRFLSTIFYLMKEAHKALRRS